MIRRCLQSSQIDDSGEHAYGIFGMVPPVKDSKMIADVGTYLKITKVERHPVHPNRFVVDTVGLDRFAVENHWVDDAGYIVAKVRRMESFEREEEASLTEEISKEAIEIFEDLLEVIP